ncbi:MAG: ribosome assembly RNA-binding protein YhbY [Myxococcales bacterium]|nr:MAG: ribosome assembly RNA-binding protein YhbY [Myxococcales bacterium]
MELKGKQRRHLRALGHHLEPVVYVGRNGLGEPQYEAIRQALYDHELIKIKLGKGAEIDLKEMVESIVANTRAACVQTLGKTALFYAPNPDHQRIKLPDPEKDGEDEGEEKP